MGDRAVSPGTPGPIGTHVVYRDRRVGSQAHDKQDRQFLPNSVRVLSQDKCIPLEMHGIANDWVTDQFTLDLRESGLNVASGHSKDPQGPSCAPLGLGSLKR